MLIPLLASVFFFGIFIKQLVVLIREIVNKKIKDETIFFLLMLLSVCCFSYYYHGAQLISSGIYLISEKESDAIEIHGTIEEIYGLDDLEFPRLKSEHGRGEPNGVCFVINDIKCKAITRGDFKVGDTVIIQYLPKSKYVLAIRHKRT